LLQGRSDGRCTDRLQLIAKQGYCIDDAGRRGPRLKSCRPRRGGERNAEVRLVGDSAPVELLIEVAPQSSRPSPRRAGGGSNGGTTRQPAKAPGGLVLLRGRLGPRTVVAEPHLEPRSVGRVGPLCQAVLTVYGAISILPPTAHSDNVHHACVPEPWLTSIATPCAPSSSRSASSCSACPRLPPFWIDGHHSHWLHKASRLLTRVTTLRPEALDYLSPIHANDDEVEYLVRTQGNRVSILKEPDRLTALRKRNCILLQTSVEPPQPSDAAVHPSLP